MALAEKTVMKVDELIGGTAIALLTKHIEITAGEVIKRGSIVDEDGALIGGDSVKPAFGIVASDVEATDEVATVYVAGQFNREKLIVKAGDTVEAHEEELRDGGIYLVSIQ